MQQDNMNKSGLAVEKTVKATWSTPKIEVIDTGSTDGGKAANPSETFPFGAS
nr:hypothetical protein [uncultured Shewanella sp.]